MQLIFICVIKLFCGYRLQIKGHKNIYFQYFHAICLAMAIVPGNILARNIY